VGSVSTIENLTIWNSTVAVASSEGAALGTTNGAGIGTGTANRGDVCIEGLFISHSHVDARDNTIAAPSGALTFSDCTIWSAGINGSSIMISSTSMFVTSGAPLFGVSPSNVGWFDLVIGYREVTSEGTERLSGLDGPFLHIGNLSIPADSRSLEFCVRDQGFERCFDDTMGRIKSLIVRGSRLGDYTLAAWVDGNGGSFATPDGTTHFAADLNDSFISVVEFVVFPARNASTYMTASDCIDLSHADLVETHDWHAFSMFRFTLLSESDAGMTLFGEAEGSTFFHSKHMWPSKSRCLSSIISTASHDAAKSAAFEQSHAEGVSRNWSKSCPFPNESAALIVTDNLHLSNILKRTASDHNPPKSVGFEQSHGGRLLRLLSSQVFSESEGPKSNDAHGSTTVFAPVASQLVFIDSALVGRSGPEIPSLWPTSFGFVISQPFGESPTQGSREFLLSQRVFGDSEVIRGSGPTSRSLWLVSVVSATSGPFCEIHGKGSREFVSRLNYSPFDRDSVDLARSLGIFDESIYRSATGVCTGSARFGVSLAAGSLWPAVTEIPSLLLSSVGFQTSGFPIMVLSLIDASIATAFDADAGQSSGAKTVWISLVAVFIVLFIVGAIVLVVLLVYRRRTSLAPTDETDGAIPVEAESSLDDLGALMSGENALSHDRGFSTPKQMNDIDEALPIARSKVAEPPDLSEHDLPE
jgi:hypothetical protein